MKKKLFILLGVLVLGAIILTMPDRVMNFRGNAL